MPVVQSLVLTTNSWVGGKNLFLGVVSLVVAGLAFIAALGFLICYHLGAVRLGLHHPALTHLHTTHACRVGRNTTMCGRACSRQYAWELEDGFCD